MAKKKQETSQRIQEKLSSYSVGGIHVFFLVLSAIDALITCCDESFERLEHAHWWRLAPSEFVKKV